MGRVPVALGADENEDGKELRSIVEPPVSGTLVE